MFVPGIKSIIQLLCRGKVVQVPRIATVIAVFGVTADTNGYTLSDTRVDVVDRTERIGDNFVVGQSTIRAAVMKSAREQYI